MPSITHETLLDLFRNRPTLVPRLRLEPSDCTVLAPTEYRTDTVVVLHGPEPGGESPVFAVVLEAQLGRDQAKRRSWPVYVATLHARWNCPTALLVVCPEPAIAAWCARPIDLGRAGAGFRWCSARTTSRW